MVVGMVVGMVVVVVMVMVVAMAVVVICGHIQYAESGDRINKQTCEACSCGTEVHGSIRIRKRS